MTTGTTCRQFAGLDPASGEAGRDITSASYSVKDGKINQVSPGVFFYYSKIKAPASNFTIEVKQSNPLSWKVIETKQIILWNAGCTKAFGTELANASGTTTFKVTGLTSGATYYVSIKYEPNSLVGQSVPGNPKPTNLYTFLTWINNEKVISSQASVTVKPS